MPEAKACILERSSDIRKKWLKSFYIYSSVFLVPAFLFVLRYVWSHIIEGDLSILMFIMGLMVLLFSVNTIMLPFWLAYNYGYKKHGTKVIGLCAILGCLTSVILLLAALQVAFQASVSKTGVNTIGIILALIFCIIFFNYYINCWKLWRLNVAIKYQRTSKSEEIFGLSNNLNLESFEDLR